MNGCFVGCCARIFGSTWYVASPSNVRTCYHRKCKAEYNSAFLWSKFCYVRINSSESRCSDRNSRARRWPQSRYEQETNQTVKPAFYKNPSRAIEKGGGFYIPGLRGPRLRYVVGALILVLLYWNTRHELSDLASLPLSYRISIFLAGTSAFAILNTAVEDTKTSIHKTSARSTNAQKLLTSQEQSGRAPSGSKLSTGDGHGEREEIIWVVTVVHDIVCGNDGAVFFFEKGEGGYKCTYYLSDKLISQNSALEAGPVVERVGEEQRALYIDDASTLPPGIGFPFLSEKQAWLTYIVPVGDGEAVLVVARHKRGGFDSSLSLSDRRWIDVLTDRISTASLA